MLKARWKSYMIPYFSLSFANLIINIPIEIIKNIQGKELLISTIKHVFWIFYSYGDAQKLPNCTPLWFLPCLFLSSVFTYYLLQFEDVTALFSTCVILSIAAYTLFRFDVVQLPWHIDTALMGSVYMVTGNKVREINLLDDISHPPFIIFSFMMIGGYCIFTNGHIDLNNNRINNIVLTYLGSVLLSAAVFIMIKAFLPRFSFLELMGKNTIIIMGFNYAVNSYLKGILQLVYRTNMKWWMISIADVVIFYFIIRVKNITGKHEGIS